MSDLIGRLDEVEDVDVRRRIISTCQEGMQVRDGWSHRLFVYNIIQVPENMHTCTLFWTVVRTSSNQSGLLPAQDGHGFPLITAGQQSIHVVMEHSQCHLLIHLQTGSLFTGNRYTLLTTGEH